MRVRTPPQRRGREPPKGTLAGPPNREDATGPIGLSSREFGRDLLGREDDRFKQAGTAVMARELQYAGRLQTGHRPSVLIRWAVRSEAHGLGSSGCGGGRGGLGWSEELVIYVGFARDAKSLEHLGYVEMHAQAWGRCNTGHKATTCVHAEVLQSVPQMP